VAAIVQRVAAAVDELARAAWPTSARRLSCLTGWPDDGAG
jgi:hypothetical protein